MFIQPPVLTVKRLRRSGVGVEDKYQKPELDQFVGLVAKQLGKGTREDSLDLPYFYGQVALYKKMAENCNIQSICDS